MQRVELLQLMAAQIYAGMSASGVPSSALDPIKARAEIAVKAAKAIAAEVAKAAGGELQDPDPS
jgi:hypothetical protein